MKCFMFYNFISYYTYELFYFVFLSVQSLYEPVHYSRMNSNLFYNSCMHELELAKFYMR